MTTIALRVAARFMTALNVGETFENEHYRIHRYADSIKVMDLTNAGKRGKKVDAVTLYDFPRLSPVESAALGYVLWAKRNSPFSKMLEQAKEDAEILGCKIEVSAYRGVDVMPAGVQPIAIRGEHIYVEASPLSFTVRDNDDQNNLPTCIPAIKGGKKSIPVFYRWVKENRGSIGRMTFRDVLKQMDALGIDYHSFCAMD